MQPCREMMQLAAQRGVELLLPSDAVVARSMDDDHGCCTVPLTPGCCSPDAPCVPSGEGGRAATTHGMHTQAAAALQRDSHVLLLKPPAALLLVTQAATA